MIISPKSITNKEFCENVNNRPFYLILVLLNWKSATDISWRHLTQIQITREAEREVCKLSQEFMHKINKLNLINASLEKELECVRGDVEKERESMRSLFLRYNFIINIRGVSALNNEALNLFPEPKENMMIFNENFNDLPALPTKKNVAFTSSNDVVSRTRGLVTRHYP